MNESPCLTCYGHAVLLRGLRVGRTAFIDIGSTAYCDIFLLLWNARDYIPAAVPSGPARARGQARREIFNLSLRGSSQSLTCRLQPRRRRWPEEAPGTATT